MRGREMVHLVQSTVHSGTHWASFYQSLNYSACVPFACLIIALYFHHFERICNSKNPSKSHADVFGLHNTRRWILILASPSLSHRKVDMTTGIIRH